MCVSRRGQKRRQLQLHFQCRRPGRCGQVHPVGDSKCKWRHCVFDFARLAVGEGASAGGEAALGRSVARWKLAANRGASRTKRRCLSKHLSLLFGAFPIESPSISCFDLAHFNTRRDFPSCACHLSFLLARHCLCVLVCVCQCR